jgi:hypothetical protein
MMKRSATLFLHAVVLALVLLAPVPRMWGQSVRKPVVVELFTSEGCSSCPPADSFLRELDSKQPISDVQVIAIEEHVDYWDGDGWRDPFSSHEFTLRQNAYAERLRTAGPYTPEMVVDGQYEFVGSDRALASQAFEKAVTSPMVPVRISPPEIRSGKVRVHIDTDSVQHAADVWLGEALSRAESQVLRGENGGRHLEHVAVARKLSKIGKAQAGQGFSKDVSVDLLKQAARIIVFLQEPGQGTIIGAASAEVQP